MEFRLTNIGYDFASKSVNVSIQGRSENKFSAVHANFPVDLPPDIAADKLESFLKDFVRTQLGAVVNFKDR